MVAYGCSGHFVLTKSEDIGPLRLLGTIGTLCDDPLLEVFSFYLEGAYVFANNPDGFYAIECLEAWHTLIHVCRRWRNLVFASPRRLNLRLVCTRRKRVRDMLHIWPTFPIVIDDQELGRPRRPRMDHVGNTITALEHRDRVCQITLENIPLSLFPLLAEMMQESFPALTRLQLDSEDDSPMLDPESFLGGSAPRLRSLTLQRISFPAIPTLLLTTKDLVELRLWSIPYSGFLLPHALVVGLSSLTKLENLMLRFKSRSLPNCSIRRSPLLTRTTLPSLTQFDFYGDNEYMEALVAQINTPLLRHLCIKLFGEALFEASQLNQFVDRAAKLKARRALLEFYDYSDVARFSLSEDLVDGTTLVLPISCTANLNFQLPFLDALSRSSPSPLRYSSLERLDILIVYAEPLWGYDMDSTPWLELLRPFTAVKDLYLDNRSLQQLTPTFQELAKEGAADVLPALRRFFVQNYEQSRDASAQGAFVSFIAARQLSGHPITVHNWERRSGKDGW